MKCVHRATRPSLVPNQHYLYQIWYEGDGFNIQITNTTIHIVDEKGMVGQNHFPTYLLNNNTKLAMTQILLDDGVVDL